MITNIKIYRNTKLDLRYEIKKEIAFRAVLLAETAAIISHCVVDSFSE